MSMILENCSYWMGKLILQISFIKSLTGNLWKRNHLYSRLANGIFWSFTGSIIAQGMSLLATVPVARLLGAKGYGELGIIQSTMMTFVILSGLSLGDTASKYLAELRGRDKVRTGKVLGITSITGFVVSALLGLIFYISAPYLASRVLNAPHLSRSLQIAAFALFFNGVNGAQIGALSGFERFDLITIVNVWKGILSLPLMIIGAWTWGVEGTTLALLVVAFITVIITWRMLRNAMQREGIVIHYRESISEWHILPSFYFPTVLSSLVVIIAIWAGNALLVNQRNGYVEMGIFNAANQWRMAIQFLPAIIARPVLPILSNLYGENAIDDFKKALRLNLALAFTTALVPALFVILASKWIMQAYGPAFSHGSGALVILALTTVLSSTIAIVGTAISSIGKRWHATWLNFLWAIVFLVACLRLVQFGSMGLAFTYMVSYFVHLITSGTYTVVVLRPMFKSTISKHSITID